MVETPRTPRTPGRPPPIAFDREESSAIHTTGGALYVWGRNSEGQCGEGVPDSRPAQCVALPHPVRGLPAPVRHVSCGTGQQGCTLAACVDGSLWSFGNDHGGRLGHGEAYGGACQRQPRRELPRPQAASGGCAVAEILQDMILDTALWTAYFI